MHIAIAAHQAGGPVSGLGRYVNELVPALVRTGPEHEFTVFLGRDFAPNHPLRVLRAPNLRTLSLPCGTGISVSQQFLVARELRRLRPDVFHHPHLDLSVMAPGRIVVTIHDLKYLRHPEFFPRRSRLKREILFRLTRRTVSRANRVIAVSEYTRRDIVEFFGVEPEKITAIHHGIRKEDPIADASSVPVPGPYVLFVGVRRPHKNLLRLINAFSQFHANHGDYRLVIVGQAYPGFDLPERLVAELGLDNAVRFTGPLSDTALAAAYRGASLFVLPSLYEGFGFPALEAMSRGVPTVVSETTSLAEVCGDACISVDPLSTDSLAGAMSRVIEDPQLRDRLAKLGRDRAAGFTWDRTARATLEVYAEVAGERRNG